MRLTQKALPRGSIGEAGCPAFIPSSLYCSFVLPSPERTSLLIVHCALQYFLDPGSPPRHVELYDDRSPYDTPAGVLQRPNGPPGAPSYSGRSYGARCRPVILWGRSRLARDVEQCARKEQRMANPWLKKIH